ncbi:MAG: methyl-accepting chemotaxis protein, partial [Spirochaetaceae bacterium]|nr:methyl-accepting chemotaxis protein [Spirochaetaceae bacterium]
MKKRENTGVSIMVKLSGLSSAFVLLAVLTLAFVSISSMRSLSREAALLMAENKVRGDIISFQRILDHEYGVLSLVDGKLVGRGGQVLNEQYDVIDQISSGLGIAATVFVRDGNDYKRITTSVRDASGQRAVNTMLGTSSAAYGTVSSGRLFIGEANILGKSHLAGYQPIFDGNSKDIIGLLFVGIEITSIEETITEKIYGKIRLMLIIALVILSLTVLLNTLVFRQVIVRPIRDAVKMLKDISEGEGDLTKKLAVSSRDEIGDMAKYFNLTFDKIKGLVLVIKRQSAALIGIGNDLASNMTESAAAINQITANIQTIKGQVMNQSAGIAKTNSTMEQITVHIERLNEEIEKQSS